MADDEATAGAVSDTTGTPATNWYHIYVPFNSGVVSQPGFTPDTPSDGSTNDCLPDPTVSRSMGSFLHIGAMNPDLLSLSNITSTNASFDANAQATFTRALNLTSYVGSGFIDDYRVRGPDASTTAQRQAESANLYSKGGWRDHTDGNRITTTVGDKVEIIGGNYVMMILGRPTRDNSLDNLDLTGSPDGDQVESSGGLSYSNDAGPGHIEEVRWVTRFGGTWMVREKSQLGDVISIAAGNNYESFVGVAVEINSGTAYSYHGPITSLPDDLKNNPDVNLTDIWRDENNQATSPYVTDMSASEDLVTSIINNYTPVYSGSNPLPSDSVYEYANLDTNFSNTIVNTVTETTVVNTSATSTTTVNGPNTETTTINGQNVETTTVNGNTNEITMIAGSKSEIELIAGGIETIAMFAGAKEEISLNAANEFSLAIAVLKEDIQIYAAHAEFNLSPEKTTYANDETDIKAMETKLAPLITNITTIHSELGATHTNLSALIVMG